MHIIHSFNNKRLDEHNLRDVGFLATNKKGNYLSLGEKNFSHMQGLFFFDHDKWEFFKTIEDIRLDKEMTAVKNNLFNVQRLYRDGASETFNLFNDSMIYSVKNYSGKMVLELDFRSMFNYDDKGRVYTILHEGDFVVIRYDKFFDHDMSAIDKTRFLVIKGVKKYKYIGSWLKKNYLYDAERKSKSEFYIYNALSINIDKHIDLVFSFSEDREKAKMNAQRIYDNKEYLIGSLKKYMNHSFTSKDIALNTAMKALDDLLISTESREPSMRIRNVGIFAGLPWFFQFWARDELISLKALMLQDKYYLVKSILFKYLSSISDDGLIPSRLPGTLGDVKSIDSVGWLFFRLKEYIELLIPKKIIDDYISLSDFISLKGALEQAIQGLARNHSLRGLIVNNEQETWMDTPPAKRKGACIEIQALFLAMINLHNRIADITRSKQLFKALEKECKERVRKMLFNTNQGMFYDSIYNDLPKDENKNIIRPNVFLAYYLYPDLLTKKEWKRVFDNVLKELWLDWGGLSTINHAHPLFHSEYTGTDDLSYHNGDSWYYINNYAAIAMHRLDKKYYQKQIKKIFEASKEEMLFSGFIGCCAEISSAKDMQSQGCLSQAWSAASFIELWHEVHSRN